MIRRVLQAGLLVASSMLLGALVLEVGFRTWGWARGIDHRLYLRELVHPDRGLSGSTLAKGGYAGQELGIGRE